MISSPGLVDKKQQPFLTSIQEKAAASTPLEYRECPGIHGGSCCIVILAIAFFMLLHGA